MDHTDAREWRFFHEDLRFYELSGLESPQEFLFKIWQQTLQLHGAANQKHLKEFAKLVTAHHQKPKHDNVLNNTVLLRLKADIFADQAKEFAMADGVNVPAIKPLLKVSDVFDAFVELKTGNNVDLVKSSLQKLAVQSMFASHNFDRLLPTTTTDDLFVPELVHAEQQNLKFNYPFLKQYFAAQFLITHLNDSSVIEFVVKTLLTSEDYISICWFLDDHLASHLPSEDVTAKFELCLYNNWLPAKHQFVTGFPDVYSVLCKLLESKLTAIYASLFKLLKRRPLILRQILLKVDDISIVKCGVESLRADGLADLIAQIPKKVLESHLERTIKAGGLGTLVVRGDRKSLGYFIEFVKNTFEPDQQIELFTRKHEGINMLLRCATSSQGGDTFKYLVANLDESVIVKMIRARSSGGSNLLHLALTHFTQESLEVLVAYLKGRNILKGQLLDTSNTRRNVVHNAIENKKPEILKYAIDALLKTGLSEFEWLDLITGHDAGGCNILHLAMSNQHISLERMAHIFKLIEQEVDATTYQQMLMRRLVSGSNLFHLAAKQGDIEKFRWIYEHIEDKISQEVVKEMLESQSNVLGNIIVTLKKTVEVSKAFLPYFDELLSADVVQEFLQGDGNILHLTCEQGKFDNFVYLFNYVKRKLDLAEVHSLLLSHNSQETNILDSAAQNPHYGFFVDLVAFMKYEVGLTELRKLLRSRNIIGQNIFHTAVRTQKLLIFEDVADVVEHELPEDYTNMLTSRSYEDDNLLATALLNDQLQKQFVKFLHQFLAYELGPDEVKRMLLNVDENGYNILSILAGQAALDFQRFKYVLEYLETVFDVATIRKLLLDKGDDNEQILEVIRPMSDFGHYYKLMSKRVDLKDQLKTTDLLDQLRPYPEAWHVLEKDDLDRMLLTQDLLLSVSVKFKTSTTRYASMLEAITTVVQRSGVEVLKQMAVHKGSFEINAFMHLCRGQLDRWELTEIFDCLHKHVGGEVFKQVLTATHSSSGENIFFTLVDTDIQTLQHLVEYLKDKLGPEVVTDMLKAENGTKKESPIFRAMKTCDNNVFAYLLSLFPDDLPPKTLETLILNKIAKAAFDNSYWLMEHWFEVAKIRLDKEVVNNANFFKFKFIIRVASTCDSVAIANFFALIELEIGDLVQNWLEVLKAAVKNPSTLALTMFVEACRKKLTRRDFWITLSTVDSSGSLLHCVLKDGTLTSVKYVAELLSKDLSASNYQAVLTAKTAEKQDLMTISTVECDKVRFNLVLTLLKRNTTDEIWRSMLLKRESTVNILVGSLFRPALADFYHRKLLEELVIDDVRAMLLQVDPSDSSSNVFHRYSQVDEKYAICIVSDFLETALCPRDVERLLGGLIKPDDNIVHSAFLNRSCSTIADIVGFLCRILEPTTLRDFLCDESKYGSMVFHAAMKRTARPCITEIYDQLVLHFGNSLIADELLRARNKSGQTILHIAAGSTRAKYFLYIVDFVRSKLGDELTTQMAGRPDVNGENVFHAAVRNSDTGIFAAAVSCCLKFMDKPTVESLVSATTGFFSGYNICHMAVTNSQEDLLPMFEFLQSLLGPCEAKRLLCASTTQNQSILQLAARFEKPFASLFDSLKPLLAVDELRGVATLSNEPRDTVFITALEFEHHDNLKDIVDCYLAEFGEETMKSVLSAPGFVHGALERVKSLDSLKCFLAQLSRFFDAGRISRWLLTFDPRNLGSDQQETLHHLLFQISDLSFKAPIEEFKENLFHVLISNESVDVLNKYWWYLKKENMDLWDKTRRKRLNNGDNIAHTAIVTGNCDLISSLFWHLFKTHVLLEMLLERNAAGLNVVDLAVNCGSVDVLLLVFDFVAKLEMPSKKRKLIPSNLPSGPTIFHSITRLFGSTIANRAFSVYLAGIPTEAMVKYFDIPNHGRFNIFHICILGGNLCAVRNIGSRFSSTFGTDLLQTCTRNRENVLHLAARSGVIEVFSYVVELVKSFLKIEEVKDLVAAVNSSGSNILHMIALQKDRQLMEAGMRLVFQAGGAEVVIKMLDDKNHIGHTVGEIVDLFEGNFKINEVFVLSSLEAVLYYLPKPQEQEVKVNRKRNRK